MDYYATILLHLESDPHADACWKLAVTLAQRFGSRVAGLSCQRSTRVAAGPAAMLEASARAHQGTDGLPELEARFLRYCSEHGCSAREFIVSDGEPAASIVRRAAEADLVVLRQPAAEGPPTARHRKLVDDVLLENPRPTLLLPRHGDFALTGDCVVVAWDGSRGAARAATDALPFLRRARAVHLVQFSDALLDDEGEAEVSVRRAAAWLASHGVQAQAQARPATIPVGEALLSAAADVGADLLVMGAWGHPRLLERVLGGVTRTLVDRAELPLLLSN